MFTGREHELSELERLYRKRTFQMVVLYGRRRVGKTTLVLEFARNKPFLAFTSKVQSDTLNLADFSRQLYAHFGLPTTTGTFATWDDAFSYLAQSVGDEQLVFMFDEFPYAASRNAALVSTLQIAIDRLFKNTNIFLVVIGSNQGFMEEKVLGAEPIEGGTSGLGEKNPLFGRRTAQIHLAPFNYLDAARMLPNVPAGQLVEYYACFGGTPYYLSMIDADEPFETNVTRLFFSKEGLLYEEPMLLLRQELREPSIYSSVLNALAGGANTPKLIADRVGMDRTSVAKYLGTLSSLQLVEKAVPYGESPKTSRRGIYRLKEPCFAYWYRFVEPNSDTVEQNAGELAARAALEPSALATYVGHWFEEICREWLIEQAKQGKLPFAPLRFGSWWGTDAQTRQQDDIDVIAGSPSTKELLLGECKWRNDFNVSEVVKKQEERARLISGYEQHWFALFSKRPLDREAKEGALRTDKRWMLVDAQRLYDGLA